MPPIGRREFIKGAAALGAIVAARPRISWGGTMADFGVARASRLFPGGAFVVHSDLHNHTLLSDGAGKPEDAFALMRASGLDVAAITDHSIMGRDAGAVCQHRQPCTIVFGIDDDAWRQTGALADAANEDGAFVAMRGFEWSTGSIGHANVWFTSDWTDPLRTGSLVDPKGVQGAFRVMPGPGPQIADAYEDATEGVPDIAHMDGFYAWLAQSEDGRGLGAFNHPNLYGDFERFKLDTRALAQMVSCEAINAHDDYLFWDVARGKPNPLNACLNAGWRVGMLGVTDEHAANFGGFDGKGRGGLWVRALSRDGVREALIARRFFATRERGLRLDAAANGVQMGSQVALPDGTGTVLFELDIAKAGWTGKRLNVQVLRPGTDDVVLARAQDVTVPDVTAAGGIVSLPIELDLADGAWVLLRLTDPERAADAKARAPFASLGRTVAYTSPWWLGET